MTKTDYLISFKLDEAVTTQIVNKNNLVFTNILHSYDEDSTVCKHCYAREDSTVCKHCYARKGRYIFPNVQKALHSRFDALGHPQWVNAIDEAVRANKSKKAILDLGLSFNEALKIVGGSLSSPSKMPGFGTSTPAGKCQVGSELAKIIGSGCNICYAKKGRYIFPNVQKALQSRFDALGHPQWVNAMATLINWHGRNNHLHFRWHDSGDIQSAEHMENIANVATLTPTVSHWIPTREAGYVRKYLKNNTIPSNLAVVMSDTFKDTTFLRGWDIPTSGISTLKHYSDILAKYKDHPNIHVCPAKTQGGRCGECRACWDIKPPSEAREAGTPSRVIYPAH